MKPSEFITTKSYKHFEEFCRACHSDQTIGLCIGQAGVGKTESARFYTKWYRVSPLIEERPSHLPNPVPFSMKQLHSILYTPSLLRGAHEMLDDIKTLARDFSHLKERSLYGTEIPITVREKNQNFAELIIIDESERLRPQAFELIRELYDIGYGNFIFIGMPGLERVLERFPQLYSRIGFLHKCQPLSKAEVKFIIEKQLFRLGLCLKDDDFTDQEAISAIILCTNGNFRLMNRLLKQAKRIMKVNNFAILTKEIIEAARSCLLIGAK